MILEKVYDELISQIEDLKKAVAAMGGGSSSVDYETQVTNLPKVNNITLKGNKKSSDLKITYSMTEAEYAAATKNAESIYCLQENATTLTDSAYVNLEVADWVDVSGVYKQTKPFVFEVTPAAGWSIKDVSIETGIASVDSYEVTSNPLGLSITYAAETLPEYGITATVTVTVSQPAGATRIMKNGLEFGSSKQIKELYSGVATASSYELSESIANFDMIIVVAGYHQQSPSKDLVITMELPSYLIQEATGVVYSLTSDVYYTNFTFADNTHISKDAENILFIQRVIGVKY